ncbi:ubiquitin-like 1-activating enzyme E1 B [Nematocida sp. LUAm3]|nr:ubiquitin-like 1-activating enzyme E1 B [Nematocida sp. LUAm3]KAI5175817.1 ubiquitin-like 1-activating enzyme E1 B [Nematocida sp. LUAm2]KAI5178313.1 ubiquitin-like 1-activating enzyme E1 B [Nematocida sp. LUAm1]
MKKKEAIYVFEKRRVSLLLVGAGGTGCEFLHSLLISCFSGNITVIDPDVIELSNLGRQRYYEHSDVGRNKAEVLCERALSRSNERVKYTAYSQSIQDGIFGLEFFKGFFCVIGCVDNIPAREHINKMCFLGNIPFIDSGSAGYLGQVQSIVFGLSECYACAGYTVQKNFPVCTIRGNPSTWHHCVHWVTHEVLPNILSDSAPLTRDFLLSVFSQYTSHREENPLLIEYLLSPNLDLSSPKAIHHLAASRAKFFSISVPEVKETIDIIDKTIPSIITTNTIIGSLIYISLIHLLSINAERPLHTQSTPIPKLLPIYEYYLTLNNPVVRLMCSPPNASCSVCASTPIVFHSSSEDTLSSLFSCHSFSYNCAVSMGDGTLIYSMDYRDNLHVPMHKYLLSNCFFIVQDICSYLVYVEIQK